MKPLSISFESLLLKEMTTGQPIFLQVADDAFELDSKSLWNVIQTASASHFLSWSNRGPLKKHLINGKTILCFFPVGYLITATVLWQMDIDSK